MKQKAKVKLDPMEKIRVTIKISRSLYERISHFKLHPRESNSSAVTRIFNDYEELKNKEVQNE